MFGVQQIGNHKDITNSTIPYQHLRQHKRSKEFINYDVDAATITFFICKF